MRRITWRRRRAFAGRPGRACDNGLVRVVLASLVLGCLAPASAAADRLLEAPTIARRPGMGARLLEGMTLLGDELDLHLSTLTGDMVRLKFDFARKQGKFKVGGGDRELLLFKVDGDVEVHGSIARVRSRIDLGLGGEALHLELPEFELATQTVAGERAVELRLPVFEGRF